MEVKVLGENWRIEERSSQEDEKLLENMGYCDCTINTIVISDFEEAKKDKMAVQDLVNLQKKVLRREIIHAFLCESGLKECSEWAENEEIVDWIAIQFPKLLKTFSELSIL